MPASSDSLARLGGEVRRVESPRGVTVFFAPAPGVLVLRASGHIPHEAAVTAIELRDEVLREHPRIHIFDDAWEATGYDSAARLDLTAWARARAGRIASHHLLVRSKIVAMGVSVANLALRERLEVHADRGKFAAALERVRAAARSTVAR